LPTKLPQARILTFGYDAYVLDWRAVISMNRIGNHSKNLLAAVATYRENDDTVGISSLADPLSGHVTDFKRTIAPSYSLPTAWEALSARM
jgi:hypothetical protein